MSATDLSSRDVADQGVSRRAWWSYSGTGVGGVPARVAAEYATMLVALAVLTAVVTPGSGGRDPGRLVVAALAVLPAVVACRPWTTVRAGELAVVATVAVTALIVPWITPSGWSDPIGPGVWPVAAAFYLAARGFARTRARSAVLAGSVLLASFDQFSRAWLPWWGGEDPTKAMIGTFYWHNPFAAFVLGGAAVGAVLAVVLPARSRLGVLVWIATPFCVAGVVLSTSRATMIALAVALAVAAGVGVRHSGPQAMIRWCALTGASLALLVVMTGPLVFGSRASLPFAATQRRSGAESLSQNTNARLDYWRAAVDVFADDPLVGAGFDRFGAASGRYLPPGAVRSPAVHNGLLQSLADGGVLHGGPVWIAFGASFGALAVGVAARLRRRSGSRIADAAAVAACAMLAHAVVDFDWTYPAVLAMTAVLIAVAMSERAADTSARPGRAPAALAGVVALATLVAAAATFESDRVTRRLNAATRASFTDRAAAADIAAGIDPRLPDPRPAIAVLEHSVTIGGSGDREPDEARVRQALARTERLAQSDPAVAMQRELGLFVLGDRDGARRRAERIGAAHYRVQPYLTVPLARLLEAAGDPDAARKALLRTIDHHVSERNVRLADAVWTLVAELDRLPGSLADYQCSYAAAVEAFGPPRGRARVRPPGAVPPGGCAGSAAA